MRKEKSIDLSQVKEKVKKVNLVDASFLIGEFRAYYKSYSNSDELATIRNSNDLYKFLNPLYEICMEDTEQFIAVYLSKANKIIHYTLISTGGITGTVADIQIILKHAILLNAKAIVISHNHPSGNLLPSEADIQLTRRLKQAGHAAQKLRPFSCVSAGLKGF